jgi:hypothetical protein
LAAMLKSRSRSGIDFFRMLSLSFFGFCSFILFVSSSRYASILGRPHGHISLKSLFNYHHSCPAHHVDKGFRSMSLNGLTINSAELLGVG